MSRLGITRIPADGFRRCALGGGGFRCFFQVGGELLEVLVERRDQPGEEWEERTADALDDLHSRAVAVAAEGVGASGYRIAERQARVRLELLHLQRKRAARDECRDELD